MSIGGIYGSAGTLDEKLAFLDITVGVENRFPFFAHTNCFLKLTTPHRLTDLPEFD